MQIVVVSDGSTDRTDEVVGGFAEQGVEFHRIESSGKPAAINSIPAHGEILI